MNDHKNPEISVVMAVYNGEEYIEDAIDSILKQSFADFEFIIINDGSTDNSLYIIQTYMATDDRIIVISNENKGLPASLNEGIALAKGKYIARMDADDISFFDRFQKQYEFMENHPEVGVCGSSALLLGKKSSKQYIMRHPKKHESLTVRLLFSVCFIHPTVIIRKCILDNLDYVYNTDFKNSQDYELWARLVDKTKFHNLQEPLLYYRDVKQGITAKVNSNGLHYRYPLVRRVQEMQLKKINVHLNDDESLNHFRLALNSEMAGLNESAKNIKKHLFKLICANHNKRIHSQSDLYSFLSRKFSIYIMISFAMQKKIKYLDAFGAMFFRGVFEIFRDKLKIFWIRIGR